MAKLTTKEQEYLQVRPDLILDSGCYPVRVLVFTSEKKYQRYLERIQQEENLVTIAGRCSQGEDPTGKQWFSMYLATSDIYTCIHECLHMAWYILDYVQVQVDKDNHEALTYLQEYLVKQLFESKIYK